MSAEDRTVVVTGAGGGIGRASALNLAEAGYRVVLADRDESGLRGTAAVLRSESLVASRVVDVTDRESVAQLFGESAHLHGCVHCAGVVGTSPLESTDSREWERILAVNLTGTFHVVAAAAQAVGDGGAIVTVSSMAAQPSSRFASPAYAASKSGVVGLTRSLSTSLAGRGIRINSVAPGAIDTSMLLEFGESQRDSLKGANPMGRLGDPSEVAKVIEFLVSDASSFVTGQVISANGGAFVG